ncbi:hypothetical protein BXZ70DRAFT_566207 [Cristinia sonorae]|uniref:Uncharacterized protein n=1 Tax=Cristinia sonorae TaxID=1940300 RepID=A0A8K0XLE7_9AGAR|nr:hypothetical protein BXZ70DRAFT_566207 [Cristinia sonorae]
MDPEAIRQARLQKQQSRYRDRGGVFVPAETNPLLDILLARGPNGESPVKVAAQASQKRTASSPTRQQGSPKTPSPLKKGRGRAGSGSTRGSMGKGSRLKVKQAPSEEDELVKPAPKHNKQTRTTAAKKGVKPKAVADGAFPHHIVLHSHQLAVTF